MDHGFDWGQIIFVIVAVGIGFIQWVYNLIQQRGQEKERGDGGEIEDPEIRRMREEAWERQTRGPSAPPAHRPAPAPTGGGFSGTLRDIFEELQRSAEEAQNRPKPPPIPGTVRADLEAPPPPRPVSALEPRRQPPAPRPVPENADELARRFATQDRRKRRSEVLSTHRRNAGALLATNLRSPDALRQAIILREILGPPKALQSSPDLLF